MSFSQLNSEIINEGLCISCGLCAKHCKHIEMDEKHPKLKDYCMLEREGLDCGRCFSNCPIVKKNKPLEKTCRERVLDYVTTRGPCTISEIAQKLELETKKIRYEALRLAQLNEIEMKIYPDKDEPVFSLKCEE
jgi:coenzyme F420-reducing hydrogenase gamma subunit